jgi:hypothetical protein
MALRRLPMVFVLTFVINSPMADATRRELR